MKFKIGDKVVPVSKSTGCNPFKNVKEQMKRLNLEYLEVISLDGYRHEDPNQIIAGNKLFSLDYKFDESDLIPYVEPIAIPKNRAPENKSFVDYSERYIFNGPATICIIENSLGKFKGVAKCSPADEWDEVIGKELAFWRAMKAECEAQEIKLIKQVGA